MPQTADLLCEQNNLNVVAQISPFHLCCNVTHLACEHNLSDMDIGTAEQSLCKAVNNFVQRPKLKNAWKQTLVVSTFCFC